MNRMALPAVLLGAALLAMLATLVWAQRVLPPQVASHFNAQGQPDAWMTREAHLRLMGLLGLGLPAGMVAIFWAVRYLPAAIVNLPHREHWLAPERRAETSHVLLRVGLWFAALETLFLAGVHVLVVQANIAQAVRLSGLVWVLLAAFLAAVAVWLWQLYRQFRLPA